MLVKIMRAHGAEKCSHSWFAVDAWQPYYLTIKNEKFSIWTKRSQWYTYHTMYVSLLQMITIHRNPCFVCVCVCALLELVVFVAFISYFFLNWAHLAAIMHDLVFSFFFFFRYQSKCIEFRILSLMWSVVKLMKLNCWKKLLWQRNFRCSSCKSHRPTNTPTEIHTCVCAHGVQLHTISAFWLFILNRNEESEAKEKLRKSHTLSIMKWKWWARNENRTTTISKLCKTHQLVSNDEYYKV